MIKHSLVTRAKATLAAALISAAMLSTTPAMAGPATDGTMAMWFATAEVCGPATIICARPCSLLGSRDVCEPTAIVTDFDDPCWSWCWLPFVPFLPVP